MPRLGRLAVALGAVRASLQADRVPEIAVVGPTQVGKSTIVNLLVGSDVAETGPVAGLTRQAHRYHWNCARGEFGVWDTPDFDSLASGAYREQTFRSLGGADALLLVLSPEKYADLSVWELLRDIEPLASPLLVCLNKCVEGSIEEVRSSLLGYLRESFPGFEESRLYTLPRWGAGGSAPPEEIARLQAAVLELLDAAPGPGQVRAGTRSFLEVHWQDWLEPARAEQAARGEWNRAIDLALAVAVDGYEKEFLEHPRRYDTFRKATARLMALLEVPGLAGGVGTVRRWVTYPARRLLEAGASVLRGERSGEGSRVHGEGSEQAVLDDLIERMLRTLSRDAARKSGSQGLQAASWKAIYARLRESEERLRGELQATARENCRAFEPEIRATADRLLEALGRRPAVLNALRTLRASTDLAGLAFAVHAGGAPLDDLVFAPAMFAATSMLTEGALGSYMAGVAADLKTRRKKAVREDLFEGRIAGRLRELADDLRGEGIFGIAPEQIEAARRSLEAWAAGAGL